MAAAPEELAEHVLGLAPVTAPPDVEAAHQAGRPFVVREVTEEMRRAAAADEEHFQALSRMRTGSVLHVPLMAGQELTGLLSLASADADPGHDDATLELAAELGSRIAAMVAAEAIGLRQHRLHEITVALSAAGTVAEAAVELAEGVHRLLGASVVTVCRVLSGDLLQIAASVGYPVEALERYSTMPFTADLPVTEAARTGEPVWLLDRDAWQARFPRVVASLLPATQAAVALPLLAGGRVVGTLAASFAGPRAFGPDERSFLLTLAAQAAVAFERAALADARREIADTLQRSLLPRRLPRLDGLAVSARYLPGVVGTQAGGDWYDVLPLDDGGVALVVGDVVGEGAPAAAVMGQLRSAVAALLLEGHPPARALELLDRFAARVDGAGVTHARLPASRPGHRSAHLQPGRSSAAGGGRRGGAAVAGRRHGPGARRWPAPGVGPTHRQPWPWGRPWCSTPTAWWSGAECAVDDGVQQLVDAAARHRTAPTQELLDRLLSALVDTAGPADDIALVAARLLPAPLRLDLPAQPQRLAELRRTLEDWAVDAALDTPTLDDLQLALGEAVANAVEHAYRDAPVAGRVRVQLGIDGEGTISARVEDDGTWRAPPGDRGFRGRGLEIARNLATTFDLQHGATGTTVRFDLRRPDGVVRTATWQHRPRATRPAGLVVSATADGRCLQLDGDLDLAGVAGIRRTALAALDDGDGPVTLDLGGLGHLASAGMGLLLELAQRAGRAGAPLTVVPPRGGPARRVLELTGLGRVLAARD